jgi:very-short-patch-repair endonuclease/endogenous inhibitor of DNA gyrase (YacG/DUF329 family)
MKKEQLQQIANNSYNKTELAIALGHSFYNGRISKQIQNLIEANDLDISHFDSSKRNRERKKYDILEKVCPQCGKIFRTKNDDKEKTTCSTKCSNIYFIDKREPTEKTKTINCIECGHLGLVHINASNAYQCENCINLKFKCATCDVIMKRKNKSKYGKCKKCFLKDPAFKQKCKESQENAIKKGNHKGWMSRKKISYPEKFFMEVLKNNNIEYTHELKVGRYFIDFAIGNIALEIDGSQHLREERIIKDKEKDKFLNDEGWIVHRIAWKSINTQNGKKYIKDKIENFLKIYSAHFKK